MRTRFTIRGVPVRSILDPALVRLQPKEVKRLSVVVDKRFSRNETTLFRTEGSSGGAQWKQLSPRYKRWKDRLFGSAVSAGRLASRNRSRPFRTGFTGPLKAENKIMTLTGDLRRSLSARGDPEHVLFTTHTPRQTIFVGTSNRKAAWHGPTRFRNPRLPIRDVLQHTSQQLGGYTLDIMDYFRKVKWPRIRRILEARRPR